MGERDSHGGAASEARATREEVRWLCGSQVSWKRFATSRNLGSCRGDHQKSISASVSQKWPISGTDGRRTVVLLEPRA